MAASRCCLAVVLIGSPAAAASDRPLSCGEIAECSDRCCGACPAGVRRLGCVLACNKQCRRQGCQSALPVYDALTSCIRKHCLRSCMGGPSPECRQCGARNCQEPRRHCEAHRCSPAAGCPEGLLLAYRPDDSAPAPVTDGAGAAHKTRSLEPTAVVPATQPETAALVRGTPLQPGQRGYKSTAVAASASVAATLIPIIAGGFITRTRTPGGLWAGLGLIALGQSFGPAVGFWYAGEKAPLTWYRLAVSFAALGTAAYPFYAYGGRVDRYNGDLAAGLLTATIVLETVAILLAAWDLSALSDAVEHHNNRPPARRTTAALVPVLMPGGGGLGLTGWMP